VEDFERKCECGDPNFILVYGWAADMSRMTVYMLCPLCDAIIDDNFNFLEGLGE